MNRFAFLFPLVLLTSCGTITGTLNGVASDLQTIASTTTAAAGVTTGAVSSALSATGVVASTAATSATQAANTSPQTAGQLFCSLEQSSGGQIVVGLIDAAASTLLGPVAILAENATTNFVQSACKAAATATGAVAGVPVSPPSTPVANVAIVKPSGT